MKAGEASAMEGYIDALYYREMYDSEACWRTPAAVDRELLKLKSKAARVHALKEHITMRVLGLGGDTLLATPIVCEPGGTVTSIAAFLSTDG